MRSPPGTDHPGLDTPTLTLAVSVTSIEFMVSVDPPRWIGVGRGIGLDREDRRISLA